MGCCLGTDAGLAAADSLAENETPTMTLSDRRKGPKLCTASSLSLEARSGKVSGVGAILSTAPIDQVRPQQTGASAMRMRWKMPRNPRRNAFKPSMVGPIVLGSGDLQAAFAGGRHSHEGKEAETPVALCRIGVTETLSGALLDRHLPSVDDDKQGPRKGSSCAASTEERCFGGRHPKPMLVIKLGDSEGSRTRQRERQRL
eukprot:scaffold1130_cov195-Pinguiococcus_pyrenoidosus.AAC.72